MNLDEFVKNLKKFTIDSIDDFKRESVEILAEDLRKLLRSGRAKTSAKKINALFKKHNRLDDDGRLITVSDPSQLADKVMVVDDTIVIALTIDENRWIRADSIFGNNVLAELGIKYRQE